MLYLSVVLCVLNCRFTYTISTCGLFPYLFLLSLVNSFSFSLPSSRAVAKSLRGSLRVASRSDLNSLGSDSYREGTGAHLGNCQWTTPCSRSCMAHMQQPFSSALSASAAGSQQLMGLSPEMTLTPIRHVRGVDRGCAASCGRAESAATLWNAQARGAIWS